MMDDLIHPMDLRLVTVMSLGDTKRSSSLRSFVWLVAFVVTWFFFRRTWVIYLPDGVRVIWREPGRPLSTAIFLRFGECATFYHWLKRQPVGRDVAFEGARNEAVRYRTFRMSAFQAYSIRRRLRRVATAYERGRIVP